MRELCSRAINEPERQYVEIRALGFFRDALRERPRLIDFLEDKFLSLSKDARLSNFEVASRPAR